MDTNRKKELQQMYKEIKTEAGVYQIRNKVNHKMLVESTRNFKTIEGRKFMLEMGTHPVKSLQEEWRQYGADAFEIEVLEVLKKKEEGYFDEADELKKLEAKWLKQLEPYGEHGYNKPKQ
ncbi:GIY-YIG nuclease family protein [Paenibacillus caui]|uniref:GIY-YIG nuclease family protein n=1 Tax=Paenibacillus caui TaxID=2873927 RepID=UPI001CA858F4|nr:GIY-YIG nuclease family protein [Paenibacillus caui]